MKLKSIDGKTFYYGKIGQTKIDCDRKIPKDPSLVVCKISHYINKVEMPLKMVEIRLNDYTHKAFITKQDGFNGPSDFYSLKKILKEEGYSFVGVGF
ncbi:MAG: hypothetical protein QXI16_04285 [Sulfolobaceae archaeon]